MNNIIYGQYDSNKYQLKRFYINDVPSYILNIIKELSYKKLAIIRGGMSFIFLLSKNDYMLKDIDMIAYYKNQNDILKILSNNSEIIYVNKNSFGNTVITSFWKCSYFHLDEYYKLDILLTEDIIDYDECIWNGNKYYCITKQYLLTDRISKIREKFQRNHDDNKTKNHFYVSYYLSEYMIKNNYIIDKKYKDIIIEKLIGIDDILKNIVSDNEIDLFLNMQKQLIGSFQ